MIKLLFELRKTIDDKNREIIVYLKSGKTIKFSFAKNNFNIENPDVISYSNETGRHFVSVNEIEMLTVSI